MSKITGLVEKLFGDENWERFKTIGWTSVLFTWIILFPIIEFWSIFVLVGFGLIVRELEHTRRDKMQNFYKYNYARIRVWEDENFNYTSRIAFSMLDVYPLELKDNKVRAKIYINSRNDKNKIRNFISNYLDENDEKRKEIERLENELDEITKKLNSIDYEEENKEIENEDEEYEDNEDDSDDDEYIDIINKENINDTDDKEELSSRALELKERIEKLKSALYGTLYSDIDYDEEIIDIGEKLFDYIEKNLTKYRAYLIKLEWSNNIETEKLILLTPSTWANSFVFQPSLNVYKNFYVEGSMGTEFSAIEIGKFKDATIMKVIECNATVKHDPSIKKDGELFDIDLVESKIAYIIRESNKLLQEYETLYYEKEIIESKYNSLVNHYKKEQKKIIVEANDNIVLNNELNEMKVIKNRISGEIPKKYYPLTISGWIVALILLILMFSGIRFTIGIG